MPSPEVFLDPDFVLTAYCHGYFPMADPGTGEVSWYSPDPRAIIPLDRFHLPRSLRRMIRSRAFELRLDTAFEEVIRSCAARNETWISEEIIRVYVVLHQRGYAHSVESWHAGGLAGGLYGVAISGAFFGESMFSRKSGASKVALVGLVELLRQGGFRLLDTQFANEHLRQFGTLEISREEYLDLLAEALHVDVVFPSGLHDV